MKKLEIELDEIEQAQLEALSGINNAEEVAALLISRQLAELVDDVSSDLLADDPLN